MHYTGQVYRHPIEGYTPLLEVTAGCSHNKCSFCTMYKETPFRVSSLADVEDDLIEMKKLGGDIRRIFLVNGEPFIMSTEKLVVVGELINKYFPNIETITCYASIKSLKDKSVEDLKRLKSLGYNDLHVGLESAYDPALFQMNKGFTSEEAYQCLGKVQDAGMRWDAIIMTGVAGKGNGEFIECTELEKIEEELLLLKLIDFEECYFFGGHNYNLIPINAPLSEKNEIIEAFYDRIKNIPEYILNGVKKRANI
ncbi:MAG: radical SAM protein [Eubacteriales bacterium]